MLDMGCCDGSSLDSFVGDLDSLEIFEVGCTGFRKTEDILLGPKKLLVLELKVLVAGCTGVSLETCCSPFTFDPKLPKEVDGGIWKILPENPPDDPILLESAPPELFAAANGLLNPLCPILKLKFELAGMNWGKEAFGDDAEGFVEGVWLKL